MKALVVVMILALILTVGSHLSRMDLTEPRLPVFAQEAENEKEVESEEVIYDKENPKESTDYAKTEGNKENPHSKNNPDKPTLKFPSGITEIPFSEGDLKVEREGSEVRYFLDEKEFASGTVRADDTFYIAHHTEIEDPKYVRGYNTVRANLRRKEDGEEMIPDVLRR